MNDRRWPSGWLKMGYQMTDDERREWTYRRDERLAILAGASEPTAEQIRIAEAEANAWLEDHRGHQ